MRTSDKFYDRVTALYPLIDLFLRPQKRKLFRAVNTLPPGRLLEIGVGNGAHLREYAGHDITAIDSSHGMIREARKRYNGDAQILQMRGEALSFPDESFDYVILSHVIAVVASPEKILQEVHRVLRPNGKMIILNHFTPMNVGKYIDIAVDKIALLLHFRSVFHIEDLEPINLFRLVSETNAGMFSYFKILVYEKNV